MPDIQFHEDNGALIITLDRPTRKNALTIAMYQQLTAELQRAAADPGIAVVLFHGSEHAFCAGNDLDDFLTTPPRDLNAPVWHFLRTLAAFPKPMVAAVCGVAVGIGATLLLHCDLVHAGSNARFSLPFVNLGLCPEAGSSLLLPRLCGYQRAAEILLLGEPFDAQAAMQTGLVSKVLEPQDVLESALAQGRKLASKPLAALMETRRLLKTTEAVAVLDRIDEEAEVFARLLETEAARKAIRGFIRK